MPRTKDHNNGILWQYILSLCPKIHNTRSIAWKYVFREILIPSVAAYLDFRFSRLALNADIIVSALGVLGGLLLAHAIFVFELRMTYNANLRERIRNKEIQAENTKLTRLINDMFYSVVYSSALALGITLAVAMGSSLGVYDTLPQIGKKLISAAIVWLMTHLAFCIYRVLKTTSGAYGELRKSRIA